MCGTLGAAGTAGTAGAPGSAGAALLPLALSLDGVTTAVHSVPWWIWPVAALLGALLGLVLLLESPSALRESRDRAPPAEWGAHLKLRALANLAAAPLGLA